MQSAAAAGVVVVDKDSVAVDVTDPTKEEVPPHNAAISSLIRYSNPTPGK